MRMSNDLPINDLSGLALDWLIGQAMGYNLTILEMGARWGKFTLNSARVFIDRSDNNNKASKVVKLFNYDGLTLFNPSQDWELIPPPDSYKERGHIESVGLFHAYQSGDEHNYLLNSWLCTYINDEVLTSCVGHSKQMAVCRAVVDLFGGWWHSVPAVLIEQDNTGEEV